MLDNFKKIKPRKTLHGEIGLPETYPVPRIDGLLFYIQRNLNQNTVVYVINQTKDGFLNEEYPMDVYWVNYTEGGVAKSLNQIQNKLAFGYKSKKINNESCRFHMVSYEQQEFYIGKNEEGEYHVHTKLNGRMSMISNIYVYAEDFGVFPQVKYIEFYGLDLKSKLPTYSKVLL